MNSSNNVGRVHIEIASFYLLFPLKCSVVDFIVKHGGKIPDAKPAPPPPKQERKPEPEPQKEPEPVPEPGRAQGCPQRARVSHIGHQYRLPKSRCDRN